MRKLVCRLWLNEFSQQYFAARIEALTNETAFLMRAAEEQAHPLKLEDVPCAAAEGPARGMRCRAGQVQLLGHVGGKTPSLRHVFRRNGRL